MGLLVAAAFFLSPSAAAGQSDPDDGTPAQGHAWVIFGADTVFAEIAGSGSERSQGLQDRDEVPSGTGMLFTFTSHDKRTFWMKDTYVDLDLAVLDEDHRIVEILHLEAESLELRDTEHVVFMALEVPGGWFAEKGIEVGDQASIVLGPDGR